MKVGENSHVLIILTKFHEDRTKNIDFLLLPNLWMCPIFSYWDFKRKNLKTYSNHMEDILIQDEVHRDVHDYVHESFDKDEVQVVGMPYFAWQLLNYHMNLLDDGLK